jgi:hypothetical protein
MKFHKRSPEKNRLRNVPDRAGDESKLQTGIILLRVSLAKLYFLVEITQIKHVATITSDISPHSATMFRHRTLSGAMRF